MPGGVQGSRKTDMKDPGGVNSSRGKTQAMTMSYCMH